MIIGTEGQIEITTPESQWQTGPLGMVLKARLGRWAEVEIIDFEDVVEVEAVKGRVFPGVNTARQDEAFVEGREGEYPDFEKAVMTHRLLDWVRKEAEW